MEKVTPNGTMTYSYGTMGELKEVVTPTQTITYQHNALNQRVAKLIDGQIVEKYLWANLTTILAIYDSNDNLIQRFEYADQRMPVSMTANGTKFYLHYDQIGSLKVVSDTNGNVVKEIGYDTYGNILSDSDSSFKVHFGFAGGHYDEDTGLTRFGYRDYDAYAGKWTAKDPIGFTGGDSNLYGYVLNNPVNFLDPTGESAHVPGFIGAGAIGGAIVGIIDASLNARCMREAWEIFWMNVSTGALAGLFASGAGFFGAVAGEAGGIGLNALIGLNGVPTNNTCTPPPHTPPPSVCE